MSANFQRIMEIVGLTQGASASGLIINSFSESYWRPFAFIRGFQDKIGVTGGEVKKRVGNAKKAPIYLLADVEIVQTFKLANIKRTKLGTLLHQFFASARLDVELKDLFGVGVQLRE